MMQHRRKQMEPTGSQMDFIGKIEAVVCVTYEEWCDDNGYEQTIGSASEYIDEYWDEFKARGGRW